MEKDIKVLIIPDVHGRTFWKEPVMEVLEHTNAPIIFLGDYHDPYSYEFSGKEYIDDSVERFKEIIELKKNYPDRITLLLGNHDAHYIFTHDNCRFDYLNANELKHLYENNIELFDIGKVIELDGKKFTFSHAAIIKKWIEKMNYYFGDLNGINEIFDYVNTNLHNKEFGLLRTLMDYVSFYRGGYDSFGSMIWADAREISNEDNNDMYQIFGHTQLECDPIITDYYACLDVRKAFIINSNNEIEDYGK